MKKRFLAALPRVWHRRRREGPAGQRRQGWLAEKRGQVGNYPPVTFQKKYCDCRIATKSQARWTKCSRFLASRSASQPCRGAPTRVRTCTSELPISQPLFALHTLTPTLCVVWAVEAVCGEACDDAYVDGAIDDTIMPGCISMIVETCEQMCEAGNDCEDMCNLVLSVAPADEAWDYQEVITCASSPPLSPYSIHHAPSPPNTTLPPHTSTSPFLRDTPSACPASQAATHPLPMFGSNSDFPTILYFVDAYRSTECGW